MAFNEHTNIMFGREEDEHEDHLRNQHHFLSRLSVCTNYEAEDEGDHEDDGEECDAGDDEGADADEEPSEAENVSGNRGGVRGERSMELNFSDSDKERSCHSLPATPPRRRRRSLRGGRGRVSGMSPVSGDKAYASENEIKKGEEGRRRRIRRENPAWVGGSMRRSCEGNVEQGGGGGVVVVTRPIGGGRALCMDLDEVKACKELGFELEAGRVSYSAGSTLDYTSSGGNSPISNWRISSPGDDPRDVKARLKAWAQAVAFVSTSSRHSFS